MKGHIHRRETVDKRGKRRTRWYAIVDLPKGPNGKRRQKWHGGFTTRREAELVRADILRKLEHGTYVEDTTLTLEQWVTDTWMALAEPQLKPTTFYSYRRNLEVHLLPRLGHHRLRDLTPLLLTATYAEIFSFGRVRGRRKGTALAPATVQYLHIILHRVLEDARTAGLLDVNPASRARTPRHGVHEQPEQQCWTANQLRTFLEQSDHLPWSLTWRLAAMTGMRRGEVLGLRWKDVDFAARQLRVTRTLVSVGGVTRESTPKNGRPRVVDLDQGTAQLLATLRPSDVDPESRVVRGPDGCSPSPDLVSRSFKLAIAATDLPMIRFHDLRHTHATLSLASGVPVRVVAERLGHSSPGFTLRRYAHVLPGMQAQAAEVFASLLTQEQEVSPN